MRVAANKATSHAVARAVVNRGQATLDDLQQDFPAMRRDQLQKALDNAKFMGLVRLAVRGQGGHVSRPGIWAAALPIAVRPPASAWELGHGLQIAGTWPPAFEGGRQYAPLGPWVEAGNDNNRSAA